MTFKEWRSLFRFDRTVDIPHLSVVCMCPYIFVRILWYFNRREFQAWPSEYETSLVLGWRWPFTKKFREKAWTKLEKMPLALYGPMDIMYLARAFKEFGEESPFTPELYFAKKGSLTIKAVIDKWPKCDHNYWVASCQNCARKALLYAIDIRGKYEGNTVDLRQHEAQRLNSQITERQAAHQKALKEHREQLQREEALPEVTE